jgi:excinuclease ABC subunit A
MIKRLPSTMKNPSPSTPCIEIEGATTHNLKGVSLNIPYRQLITIVGLSGSGKSSLAFNTICIEGKRRYMESLNTYLRQFLERIDSPPVDRISGIPPSIGIQQKARSNNPRARISTTTDLYPYLKLFFARLGKIYSPISGEEVKKNTVDDVISYILQQQEGSKVMILAPILLTHSSTKNLVATLRIEMSKGFSRFVIRDKIFLIEKFLKNPINIDGVACYLVVDRLLVGEEKVEFAERIADSTDTAFFEGRGKCLVRVDNKNERLFSDILEADGMTFEELTTNFFSFNNPFGACELCKGLGKVNAINIRKVIADPTLTLAQGAVTPWRNVTVKKWQQQLTRQGIPYLPMHRPYEDFTAAQKQLLWEGNQHFKGIAAFFVMVESKANQPQYRFLLSRYRGNIACLTCQGTGLRPDVAYVKVGDRHLIDVLRMTVDEVHAYLEGLCLAPHEEKVGEILLTEMRNKISYLREVGLGYLHLNRPTRTLSGGEYQRIKLAKALGNSLVDVLYVLDEPTVGLHPRDTDRLIKVLLDLQKAGNTVIVVEHEEAVMRRANQIIEIGPKAGREGGEIVFQGTWDTFIQQHTITADYLANRRTLPQPTQRKAWKHAITVRGAYAKNLKHIDFTLPIGILTVMTGVSGSGKSTLVHDVFSQALARKMGHIYDESRRPLCRGIEGSIGYIKHVEQVGQDSFTKSSRSNPVTYTKTYDLIRRLFAEHPLAIDQGYTSAHFSFNISGGRCEKCMGTGKINVDMQFMADITITCEECQGKRFKKSLLKVLHEGKDIAEVLEMTVDQAITFFAKHPPIVNKLLPLQKVGLGYLQLGQSSSTFSGGEAQRMKISSYLGKGVRHLPTLFIFDEPTTGLHFHDINKLIHALRALVEQNHTVLIIEHNVDMIRCADWIVDLGPEGGNAGGEITFAGTPEEMCKLEDNHTARYLREKMESLHTVIAATSRSPKA